MMRRRRRRGEVTKENSGLRASDVRLHSLKLKIVWTVNELTEARNHSPPEAKVLLRDEPDGAGKTGKAKDDDEIGVVLNRSSLIRMRD
jgi:hypothetical protein